MKSVVEKREAERLTLSERWAGLIVVLVMLLLFAFFAYHQFTNTGFMTSTFGPVEMLALYGPILVSFAAPVVRALKGRRNPARPFDAATNLFLAIGSLWLAIVFPLSFSHLADPIPGAVRFVISWITDDIGRAVLILQVLIGAITAVLTTFQYVAVSRRESENGSLRQGA